MSEKIGEEIKTIVESMVERYESQKRDRLAYNKLNIDYKKTMYGELINDIKLILESERRSVLQPFIDSLSKITHFNSGGFRTTICAKFGETVFWSISYEYETSGSITGKPAKTVVWRFRQGILTDLEFIGLNYVALRFKEINDLINDHEDKLLSMNEVSKRIKF